MVKNLSLIGLLLTAFILSSCDTKQPATGLEDEIYVVADSVEFEGLKTALESTFEKKIYTPLPENLFELKRVPLSKLDMYKRKKNIIITAPLDSKSAVSDYLNSIIDSSLRKRIQDDSTFVLEKKNLWARNQLVMVLSAPTMQELEFKILNNGDNLLYAFQKSSDERLMKSVYNSRYEQEDVEGKLLKDYGWVIFVQADFQVAINNPEDHFVWLRRSPGSYMERWIFVHWIDNASPAYLNVDSVRAIRNRMTKKFYRTTDDTSYVVIAKDYFTSSEVNFNGRYAIFTQGLWDLNVKGMGGPFVNYTFFDQKTKRLYMLDGSIFAPKYYKRNLIQQLDVMLQSFRTADQLSKDRKEDLLEAAKE